MPLFEFECQDCGAVSEVLVGRGELPPACEECGGGNVRRLLSTFAIGGQQCSGMGACERWPDGQPSECPPGRCCGVDQA